MGSILQNPSHEGSGPVHLGSISHLSFKSDMVLGSGNLEMMKTHYCVNETNIEKETITKAVDTAQNKGIHFFS